MVRNRELCFQKLPQTEASYIYVTTEPFSWFEEPSANKSINRDAEKLSGAFVKHEKSGQADFYLSNLVPHGALNIFQTSYPK